MQPATEHFGGRFCVVGEQEGKNMARLTYLTLQMLTIAGAPVLASRLALVATQKFAPPRACTGTQRRCRAARTLW